MKKYFIPALVLAVLVAVGTFSSHAQAAINCGAGCKISGWAWSSNIGWASLSSTTPFAYGLTVTPDFSGGSGTTTETAPEASNSGPNSGASNIAAPGQLALNGGGGSGDTGTINGYMWSPSIGWIKFGNLSAFPVGSGTYSGNVAIDFASGKIKGWARACAGTAAGDCSTMTSRTDGWDGWISLSGSQNPSPGSGVTLDTSTGAITGYAWGGTNVGWITFNGSCIGGTSGCGNTGQVLTGTCSTVYNLVAYTGSQIVPLPTGSTNLTYTVAAQNGTGPYTYAWTNPVGTRVNQTKTFSTPGPNAGPNVDIHDTVTGYDATPICPSAVVSQPGQAMKLSIGAPGVSPLWPTSGHTRYEISNFTAATKSYYALDAGESFQFQWDIDPSYQFTECYTSGSKGPNLETNIPNLDTDFYTTNNTYGFAQTPPVSGTIMNPTPMRTIGGSGNNTGLATGIYTFSLTCDVNGANTQSSSVKLDVTSTHEGEH